MPIEILMPALSPYHGKGTLSKWVKNEGDTVKSGDVIAEIETDKATMEVEAVDEGVLGKILIAAVTGTSRSTPRSQSSWRKAKAPTPWRPRRRPMRIRRLRLPVMRGKARAAADEPASSADNKVPAAPKIDVAAADPAIPAGTEMVTMTVREALFAKPWPRKCAPIPDVFIMGEEVAEYQGAYKITQACCRNSARSALSTPRSPSTVCRYRCWCRHGRSAPDRRVHDLQLRHAGDRPDHQFGRQDALHVRWPDGRAHGLPWSERCSTRVPPSTARLCRLVQPHPPV